MFNVKSAAGLACLIAGTAHAGGIERARPAEAILFEEGNYAQFTFLQSDPKVSGDYPAVVGGGSTGDMAGLNHNIGGGLKFQLTDRFDFALLVSQPYSANASYGEGFYNGLTAKWRSTSVDALLKFDLTDRVAVYGGPSMLTSSADITIPLTLANVASDPDGPTGPLPGSIVSPYRAQSSKETDFGFVVGAAYQIPEYKLRVALTYRSEIEHEFDARETYTQLGLPGPTFAPISVSTKTPIKMPQSLALDFQSGVNPKTLVFGSVKWTEWSKWKVKPGAYAAETGREITGFKHDTLTYQLGVGRAITERLSLFARVGHETKKGSEVTRLSPVDGYTSLGIGATYTVGDAKITAGIEHAWLGDAESGTPTDYTDNTAMGFGVTIGFKF